MKKIILFALIFTLIFSLFSLESCKKKVAVEQVPQEFTYNISAEPQFLDPGKATGIPEFTVLLNLFDGLTRYDATNTIMPSIAEKWDIDTTNTKYTFYLKKGLKWSNGDPLTAKDFEFAWKRALSPELASEYAYQLWYLKNGEAYNTGKIKDSETVGVKATDDYTLSVELTSPTPYFLSLLTFTTYLPVDKKVVEANPDWAKSAQDFVSNGPFVMKDWIPQDKIIIEKNPNYWDSSKVRITKITLTMVTSGTTELAMFESDQLDFAVNPPPVEFERLKKENKLTIEPYIGTYYYMFNTTKPPFNDIKVRRALTLAIDRKSIVDNITKGGQIPALAFVPFGIKDANSDKEFRDEGGNFYTDNNFDEAKGLLAEAGYPDGKGFPKFKLLYNTNEVHQTIAQAIQQMWKEKLGIECELTNQEWQVYLDNRDKLNFDIARAGWIGDYADPNTFLDLFMSGSGNNDTGWTNKNYDELITKAKTANDYLLRMTDLHQAESILMDNLPIMPIYFYTRPVLVKPWLKGYIASSLGYTDFKWAYIENTVK
jgi:oligopeptide transport system substrate-binding protein